MNRDGVPRPRRGGRFLIVTLWFDPHGTAGAGPADKREYPKRHPSAFREFARRIPSIAPSGRPTRERGRPARILSLELSLSFPAMRHPALLPVEIAWVRPKQRHGALAGRPGSRRWARPCQCCAGGTPALPGGHSPMTPRHQRHNIAEAPGRRSSLKQLHPYSCLFVVRLHFQNENGWLLILSILCIHVQ